MKGDTEDGTINKRGRNSHFRDLENEEEAGKSENSGL